MRATLKSLIHVTIVVADAVVEIDKYVDTVQNLFAVKLSGKVTVVAVAVRATVCTCYTGESVMSLMYRYHRDNSSAVDECDN